MIKKVTSSVPGHIDVSFELPSCLWADRIFLVGDFNGWNETATPLQQDRSGIWRVTVALPQEQRYEFRYLIDGKWMSDSHADGFAENSFGISNSVVHTSIPVPSIHGSDSQLRESTKTRSRTFRLAAKSDQPFRQPPPTPVTEVPRIPAIVPQRVAA